jgi:glutamate racemase
MTSAAPVGVFDSGVGGLSVLRDLRRLMPAEDLIYYADSAHCPYGGQPNAAIQARAVAITEELLAAGCKMIVVACNTATIAAVEHLRANYPVPFVGMEPAVKPACAMTKTGVVGVLATGAALGGEKFHRLLAQHAAGVRVITQPCPGLVECVEAGDLKGAFVDELVKRYVEPLARARADVIVLGCTHYPFLRDAIQGVAGAQVQLIDTGEAVARQARRVLEREELLNPSATDGRLEWRTSGDKAALAPIVESLLAPS